MAVKTPPLHRTRFATSGGADKARPSFGPYIVGFTFGSKNNFNSTLNYIEENVAEWAKFSSTIHAPELAVRNVDYKTDDYPFTTGLASQAIHIRYDDLADKWYATSADLLSSSNIRCFDSDDGETWSAEKRIVTTDANDEHACPIWSNGTVCATATTEASGPTGYFWISTDLTVANMAKAAGSFNNIAHVYDMLYDEDSSRWYVLGVNSGTTTGYIESSGDNGATWVLETTSTNNLRSFATDQNGTAIAVANDSTVARYCTAGMDGTWSDGPSGVFSSTRIHYLPHLNMFAAVGSAGSLMLWHDSDVTVSAIDTDYDFDACIFSDDLVLFEGDTGTRSTAQFWYSIRDGGFVQDAFVVENLGKIKEQVGLDWDAEATFRGGKGKLVWVYGSTDRLAVARYGPETET